MKEANRAVTAKEKKLLLSKAARNHCLWVPSNNSSAAAPNVMFAEDVIQIETIVANKVIPRKERIITINSLNEVDEVSDICPISSLGF